MDQAELFVLDPDGFKKVTVKRFENEDYGTEVVYLQKGKEKTKLRTGFLYRDGFPRAITGDAVVKKFIPESDVLAVVLSIELLKPSELNPPRQ